MIIALIALGPALIGTGYAVHFALACSVLAIVPLFVSKLFGWWHPDQRSVGDAAAKRSVKRSARRSSKRKPADVQRLTRKDRPSGQKCSPAEARRKSGGGERMNMRKRRTRPTSHHRRRRHRAGVVYGLKRRGLDVAILDAGEPHRAPPGGISASSGCRQRGEEPGLCALEPRRRPGLPALADELRSETGSRSTAAGRRLLSLPLGGGPRRPHRTFTRMREDLDGDYPFDALERAASPSGCRRSDPTWWGAPSTPTSATSTRSRCAAPLQSAFLGRGGRLYPGRAVDASCRCRAAASACRAATAA